MIDFTNLPAQDKIYYRDDSVVIYCCDNREILPLFHDKSFDLVLTDPPYGVGLDYDIFDDTRKNVKQLVQDIIPACISKSQRVAVTSGVTNILLYPEPKWIICWFNRAGANRNPWGFSCWQPILVYGNDPYLGNGMGARQDFIEHNETSEKNGHPCPKPLRFWEKLLARTSVLPSDIVLDPFLGSGTTAVAAKILGRKCVGIEISEAYCKIAAKRCSQSVMQLEIPKEEPESLKLL